MTKNRSYSLNDIEIKKIIDWAKLLEKKRRGDRAKLRRAATPDDIFISPEFHVFLNYLKEPLDSELEEAETHQSEPNSNDRIVFLAIVAGLVARLDHNSHASFPEALGDKKKPYSEDRFQRLLQSRDENEFFRRMHTALHFLNGKASIRDVCLCISSWYKEYKLSMKVDMSEQFKFQMAKKYYQF